MIYICLILCLISFSVTNADPLPHSDHSKLYILSRLAFNYLDLSGDSRLSEKEMDDLRYFPVNGLSLETVEDVKNLRLSMDTNKNGFVDEDEFINFEQWLPIFVNGHAGSVVKLSDLQRYAESANIPPAYNQLDKNGDGQLDQKELNSA